MFIKIILTPLLFCAALPLFAQQKSKPVNNNKEKIVLQSGIRIIAKSYGDSIVLRWAPMMPWAWHKLNTIGYKVERIDISEKDNASKELLTPTALKPYSLDKFKASFNSNNANAAVAAQCLYGKNFESNLRQGQAGIADRANVTDTRYAFTLQSSDYDAGVAVATALRFTDKKVKKGGHYIYRVMPAAVATQGVIDTGSVLITNTVTASATKPTINDGIAFDRMAELHWDRLGGDNWSGYYIERSEDGKTFTPINKLPFITSRPDSAFLKEDSSKARAFALLQTQHVYIDSLPQNYKTYMYRIRGINPFAEISDYSNTVALSGRDLTAPVPVNMLNPQFVGGRKIKVLWNKATIEKDCKGYYITRAKNTNGPYETINKQLLPPTATSFDDEDAFVHGRNFYTVVALDTANNISTAVPAMGLVPDNTAPAMPTGLQGRIDKKGLVHLAWNTNKEEDIKGYKVYFANTANHVFAQITTEPDSLNSFVDSINLKTLTKDIWYKIAAVDYNNNHSEFSAAVKLRKPDIVPPTPPIGSNVLVNRKGVDMDWIQSSSPDAASYIVYRQEEKNTRTIIARFKHNSPATSFHFTDTTVKPNLSYQYTAEAIDEDSLHSPVSVPVQVKVNALAERPAITTLKATYDDKLKSIQLNWQYSQGGDYFFIVYRGVGTEPLQRWQSAGKETLGFNDINTTAGQKYRYAVQAVYKDDKGSTRLGEAVEVNR
jgi:fibronectin type 3 domain-containing protein